MLDSRNDDENSSGINTGELYLFLIQHRQLDIVCIRVYLNQIDHLQ